MKVSHILCAMLACAPLTFEARATASSEDGPSSVAAPNVGEAVGGTAPSRTAGAKAGRSGDRGSAQAGARTGVGSKGQGAAVAVSPRRGSLTPQGGVAQGAHSNADRLHSLLNAQAHGRLARKPSRPVGSTRGVTQGPDVRGLQGVSPSGQPRLAASNSAAPPAAMPSGQPRLAASNSAAPPAARPVATPRNSTIGGPHAQGSARVGGPAIGRTVHNAIIDGSQQHHKF
jgi:hypothetical protein